MNSGIYTNISLGTLVSLSNKKIKVIVMKEKTFSMKHTEPYYIYFNV